MNIKLLPLKKILYKKIFKKLYTIYYLLDSGISGKILHKHAVISFFKSF